MVPLKQQLKDNISGYYKMTWSDSGQADVSKMCNSFYSAYRFFWKPMLTTRKKSLAIRLKEYAIYL